MELKLTKSDVALRQLNAAIKMYFYEEDPVSIHTLSMAAFNVFDDLYAVAHGEKWFNQTVGLYVYDDKQKFFIKKIREAHNFFKHADKDHQETLSWNTENAFMGIFMAMVVASMLNITSPQVIFFRNISMAKYPDMWKLESLLPKPILENMPNMDNVTPSELRNLYEMTIRQS